VKEGRKKGWKEGKGRKGRRKVKEERKEGRKKGEGRKEER
jgi:hypothetical protein